MRGNVAKAKAMLKEEGYVGSPVVLLYATDTNTGRLTPIKTLLERAGFTVDMQAMDWNTVVARRTRKKPAVGRRLERFPDGLDLGRRARSGHERLRRRELREDRHRLAVRRQDRGVA